MTAVDALTADGGIVTIRPAGTEDRAALTTLFREATPENLRLRFFTLPGPATIADEIDRLTRPQSDRHLSLLAEEAGEVIGVVSCEHIDGDEAKAEFSVFVAEPHHGRGVATLLLEHLGARARRHGITELVGEVLIGNSGMLRVAHDLSGHAWSHIDHGVVDVGVGTIEDEAARLAVEARERIAEKASLRPVLAPASVAVVGASRRRGTVGRETLEALWEFGFTGPLYAVNRAGDPVGDVPGFASVADLPVPVDLLVVAVPAEAVAGVLAEASAVGVRGAIVLSAGFGEDGPEGRRRQRELLRIARTHGIRLVGPNCLGVITTDPRVRLNASFAPSAPTPGSLAIASQSGAVAIALLDSARRTGCGISSFVSLGNKADISGNDLIAYWYDDPRTHAVALYLESFGNPRKFARTVRALSRRKPVLALKSGRSIAGARAGASHTAAAAAPSATVDALFAQAGVIRVDGLGDLLDAARMVTDQPIPAGNRVAVVGNAGGLNVLAADAAEACGLVVPSLSEELRARLRRLAPGAASADNPLDLGAGATPAAFAATAGAVAGSGEVDALVLVVIGTKANAPDEILDALAATVDADPGLPVAAVVIGGGDRPALGHRRVPVYPMPERAVAALGHAAAYGAWRQTPLGRRPDLDGIDAERARSVVSAAEPGWQPAEVTATILSAYGIPLTPTVTVHDADAAVAAAEAAGYPVVLKSADPDLVHKTDTGGVALRLTGTAAVRSAFERVGAAGRPGAGVLVQHQVEAPIELVAGLVHDPVFGSVVMAGLGGVHTDVLGDRALRLVPLTDLDAGRMWRELRSAPLLRGHRGDPPVDTAALEDLLLRLGRLAEDRPEVAELDLNPVLAGPAGVVAVDAKLRLAPVGAEPDPVLRRLTARDA